MKTTLENLSTLENGSLIATIVVLLILLLGLFLIKNEKKRTHFSFTFTVLFIVFGFAFLGSFIASFDALTSYSSTVSKHLKETIPYHEPDLGDYDSKICPSFENSLKGWFSSSMYILPSCE